MGLPAAIYAGVLQRLAVHLEAFLREVVRLFAVLSAVLLRGGPTPVGLPAAEWADELQRLAMHLVVFLGEVVRVCPRC